jgi:hypothetical protein
MLHTRFWLLLGCLCLPAGTAFAATWRVNVQGTGDAPTSQAAGNESAAVDTLLVAPGTSTWRYQGTSSDFGMVYVQRGMDHLTLRSEAGAAFTIIDAEMQGRAFFIQGWNYLTLDGFTIQNGVAPALGYFAGGGVTMHLSYEVIRNCVFRNNSAGGGGALWCGGVSAPQIINCDFYDNTAERGGAIFFVRSSTNPTLSNCRFYRNRSHAGGGALYATENGVTLENCVMALNVAGTEGGAIYLRDTWATFINGCTLADNEAASASAVFAIATDPVAITRSIVARGVGSAPFAAASGSLITVSCTDVWGNAGGAVFPAGVIDGGSNQAVDPLFCGGIGSLNYHLTAGSPCAAGACGQLGALGIQCGSVAVRHTSWGRVKALYR